MSQKSICVLGMGYIGLPTAALLASRGYDVHGVDVVKEVVDTINQGRVHIVEPDLERHVSEAVKNEKLSCDMVPREADVFIIAVPTPFHEGHVPNTDYIKAAAQSIAPFIKSGNIIVLESTSPVGATDEVAKVLQGEGVDTSSIYIAHCPERVLPGRIMQELVENDRIVGGVTPEATKITAAFYREFVAGEVLETDAKTAEMAKLTENSFRDVNIAFANELSMLCDQFGINVQELISLTNHHPRVNVLNPGVGVGGHCIAVDPWFIIHKAGDDAKIIRTAREVNLAKTEWVVDKIKEAAATFQLEYKNTPKIACLGLSYKPDIDDLRESPALDITKKLIAKGYDILAVEPNIHTHNELQITGLDDALSAADIVILLVPHKEFKRVEHERLLDFCG